MKLPTRPAPTPKTTERNKPIHASDAYLHIKVRGHSDQPLFMDPSDFHYFEFLLQHNLTDHFKEWERTGGVYPEFYKDIELLCFSILENRLYLLLHQTTELAAVNFLQTVLQRYARYFRLKYERIGPVFDPIHRVAPIRSQRDFDFVSRSIHLSPTHWLKYRYSSLHYYLEEARVPWLKVDHVLSGFTSPLAYLAFLKNYEHYQENLKTS